MSKNRKLFAFGDVVVPASAVDHITKQAGLPPGYHSITCEQKHKTLQIKIRHLPHVPGKKQEKPPHKRSSIAKFSFSSQKRLKDKIFNSMWMMKTELTLTYPGAYISNGIIVKNHLKRFTQWLTASGYKWIWVLEFQERGAPHFHFAIDGELNMKVLAQKWYDIVDSNDPKHLKAGTSIGRIKTQNGYGRYLAKYYGKLESKEVPSEYENVGRFWGASKGIDGKRVTELYTDRENAQRIVHSDVLAILRKWNKFQRKSWSKRKTKKSPYYNPTPGFKLFNPEPILKELEKRKMLPLYMRQ